MVRTDQAHQAIARDARAASLRGEFARLDGLELRAARPRLADPHHEIGCFRGVRRDQVEAEDASVAEMNGPGGDRAPSGFRLVFGDDQQLRQPGLDADVKVEPCPGPAARAANRPSDGRGGFEEGAVDGEDLAVERGQRPGGFVRPRFQHLAPEMIEDRLQACGVGQLAEVAEGAFAEVRDGEMPLGLPRLAEVLDGPQGSQRGVEKARR